MRKKNFKALDFTKVRTYPVTKRFSKVQTSLLGKKLTKGASVRAFLRSLPGSCAQNYSNCRKRRLPCDNRTVVLGMARTH